jgi:hypothetical protein
MVIVLIVRFPLLEVEGVAALACLVPAIAAAAPTAAPLRRARRREGIATFTADFSVTRSPECFAPRDGTLVQLPHCAVSAARAFVSTDNNQ